ncbi:MAG TPA: alpha/beta hydrolase-fold protein, partial [Abditibacteriaceae bacterium]
MKFITAACIAVLLILPAKTQEQLTPKSAQAVLAANPDGEAATQLANRLRAWFGADNLKKGPNPKTNQLDVAWAIETPGAKSIHVVSDDGDWRLPLKKLGATDVWAVSALLPEGTGLKWHYDVDGKAIGGNFIEVYSTPIEAMEQGAPKGKVTEMPVWKSNIFPGTERKWWVYVPAQYKDDKPACVMVFQDGNSYRNWVPTVFDNLIAKGEMPVTVGVFIDPGVGPNEKRNRSFEYDTLSDQYARFLLEEILPEVEKTTKLKKDAASRAI